MAGKGGDLMGGQLRGNKLKAAISRGYRNSTPRRGHPTSTTPPNWRSTWEPPA
jgi:hypothetical protein